MKKTTPIQKDEFVILIEDIPTFFIPYNKNTIGRITRSGFESKEVMFGKRRPVWIPNSLLKTATVWPEV